MLQINRNRNRGNLLIGHISAAAAANKHHSLQVSGISGSLMRHGKSAVAQAKTKRKGSKNLHFGDLIQSPNGCLLTLIPMSIQRVPVVTCHNSHSHVEVYCPAPLPSLSPFPKQAPPSVHHTKRLMPLSIDNLYIVLEELIREFKICFPAVHPREGLC
jgi:hypothetical protein